MYAIISLQGKQYRVEEGQRLIVDRLSAPADKPFHPPVLFVGGDGKAEFSPKGAQVTAKVVQDMLGDKIRIGKYKPKSGIRRHTGHRSKLTEIEITAIGLKAEPKKAAEKPAAEETAAEETAAEEAAAEEAVVEEAVVEKPAAEKKAPAKPKAAAKKPAAKKAPAKKKEDA
jgi:large subunit ribosomal protein L21